MQSQSENLIPIDIHSNKLLDWLISRRHCNRDWQDKVITIRKKINNAIQDMPEVQEIKELLAGSYINYFHCQRIIEILRETEKNSKNIFGQYSSQRMKDWQEILRMYEANNIYLAEAAQMLSRNVSYEVPSLKKQIAKCQQAQEDCLRKEVEYGKMANEQKEKYIVSCKEIGIQGNNLRKELLELLKDLPDSFNRVTENTKTLKEAMDFYIAFLNFTLGNEDVARASLPLLRHVIDKGNTTVYEYKYKEIPEVVEEIKPEIPLDVESKNGGSEEIDFGDDSGGIDFGDENSSSTTNGDFVHVEKIDFGDEDQIIELGSPAISESNFDFPSEASDPLPDGKVARGVNALSVLDHQETRNSFLNDLRELEGFLEQRLLEMQMESDVLSGNQFQSAPQNVQLQTSDSLDQMQRAVHDVLSQLVTLQMQHLYLIQESPKYVDRLVESLQQKLSLSEKMLLSQEAVIAKQGEAKDEQRSLLPKVDLIVGKTKILQKQIENDISKKYKDRPVNILGGINTI